jgi:hypothetical protein
LPQLLLLLLLRSQLLLCCHAWLHQAGSPCLQLCRDALLLQLLLQLLRTVRWH